MMVNNGDESHGIESLKKITKQKHIQAMVFISPDHKAGYFWGNYHKLFPSEILY